MAKLLEELFQTRLMNILIEHDIQDENQLVLYLAEQANELFLKLYLIFIML